MNIYLVSVFYNNEWVPINIILANNAENAIFITRSTHGYYNFQMKAEILV